MKDWTTTLISPQTSILEVINIIETNALQIALVADNEGKLIGTVTDGDLRRAILKKVPMESSIDKIMFTSPTVASIHDKNEAILTLMKKKDIRQIPILDDFGRIVDLKTWMELFPPRSKENIVILMAGGLGTRLRPLTNDCPKPLLEIGGKPILETILERFLHFGFYRFYISVNYKSQMIENHFGDGSDWGAEINYLRESQQQGTAGALSLLPENPGKPVVVMNGDLLTKINFSQLLTYHCNQKTMATMTVKGYDLQVPYGVVQIENNFLVNLDEKPTHHFFVNAGIYVIEPEVLEHIPKKKSINMTDIFKESIKRNDKISIYPIRDYWIDIGKIDDYEKANGEFNEIFNKEELKS